MYSIVPLGLASERGERAAFHRRPSPRAGAAQAAFGAMGASPPRENRGGWGGTPSGTPRVERKGLESSQEPRKQARDGSGKVGSFHGARHITLVVQPCLPHPRSAGHSHQSSSPFSSAIHFPSRTFHLRGQEGSPDLF